MTPLAPGAALVEFDATPGDTFLLPARLNLSGLASSLTLDGLEAGGSRAAYVSGASWPEGEDRVCDMHCLVATLA